MSHSNITIIIDKGDKYLFYRASTSGAESGSIMINDSSNHLFFRDRETFEEFKEQISKIEWEK